jgi:hypothetical protein
MESEYVENCTDTKENVGKGENKRKIRYIYIAWFIPVCSAAFDTFLHTECWNGDDKQISYIEVYMIWYIGLLHLGWHPVAVIQYKIAHKQYTVHDDAKYT